MTTVPEIQDQNKEERENKFLSERIIQKALEQREIDSASADDVKGLFKTVLLQHKGDAVRARAELLMSTLRDYLTNKKQSKDSEDLCEKDKAFLQKTINEKIVTAGLSEQLLDTARETIFNETRHVMGTGVSFGVIERFVSKELEAFKQTHDLNKKQQDDHDDSQKEISRDEVSKKTGKTEDATEGSIESEEKENNTNDLPAKQDVSKAVAPAQPRQSASQSLREGGDMEEPVKRKQSLTEIMLEKARKDDKNNPLKPNTLHRPTSMISFDTPDKTAKSSDSDSKAFSADISTDDTNKALLTQAKDQLKNQSVQQLPISIQSKADIPARRDEKPKKAGTDQRLHKGTQVQVSVYDDDSNSSRLSSASNTKMVFDGSLDLDGSRIEAKHSLHKQNRELFDRYITEQIDIVEEAITQNNDLPSDMISGIRDDLTKHAVNISKNDTVSISKRMRQLDNFFHEQKREYSIKRIDDNSNPESFVDAIIERSKKEVKTGDQEADDRFRETLRNTLYFKLRHLVSAGQDSRSISIALNEEYAKHKVFYTKNT